MKKSSMLYGTFLLLFVYQLQLIGMQMPSNGCAAQEESLADENIRESLRTQFPISTAIEAVEENEAIDLCLYGKLYTVIGKLGVGEAGDVYKIIDLF